MDLADLHKPTDWFNVHEMKSVDDPSKQVKRKELVVDLAEFPYGFSLGPNPREPVISSPVSKKIGQTLAEAGDRFHLLNRGITIVAKDIEVANGGNKRVKLSFAGNEDEERFYGILDGGNTNARINKWRQELDAENPEELKSELRRRFVNVQVLVPVSDDGATGGLPTHAMVDLLNDIKEARNTSVQVKSRSLADARRHFDMMKDALSGESYFTDISWHEGQKGTIDSQVIITLLMMMYPSFCDNADGGEPSNAYGHKDRCLEAYIEFTEKEPDRLEHYIKMLPSFLVLYENIQASFPSLYGGRFGRLKEVRIHDEKQYDDGKGKKYLRNPTKTYFFRQELKYSYPAGWIYPIYAAFRALVDEANDGTLKWRRDPQAFWSKYGAEVCARFEPHMKEAQHEVKKIATSVLCYQSMRQTVTEFYKDDLLRSLGHKV